MQWSLLATLLHVVVALVFLAGLIGRAMAEARQQASWTPELRAAFADPGVALASRWELISVGLVLTLMVLKPNF